MDELQAYGLVERVSEDVDLFTNRWNVQDFAQAVQAVRGAYETDLGASTAPPAPTYGRRLRG